MNINKVTIAGRLTRDPELKSTSSGTSVCEFSIAVNRRYVAGGEKREETTYVDVAAWSKVGEIIAKHFNQGKTIYIEGRLKLESWNDQSGKKRSKLRVIAESFEFVDRATAGSGAVASTNQRSHNDDDDDINF